VGKSQFRSGYLCTIGLHTTDTENSKVYLAQRTGTSFVRSKENLNRSNFGLSWFY